LLATLGTIFVLIVLLLLEGPKMRQGLLKLMRPERAAYYTRVAGEISQSATGYALGNLLTSLIAGVVVFVTLTVLGVPFPLLWALWVALVDFLPMVGAEGPDVRFIWRTMCLAEVRYSHLAFDIARTNDKRVTPSFPAERLSGGLVGEK
jgi:AI-2E family transporter